jgi:hypothetical protein
MITYRVKNLHGLVKALREEDCNVLEKIGPLFRARPLITFGLVIVPILAVATIPLAAVRLRHVAFEVRAT